MKVAIVHNLKPGGARRRLAAQIKLLDHEMVEVTLSTGSPITESAVVVPVRRWADKAFRLLRPPLRYIDVGAVVEAWRQAGRTVAKLCPDLIFANPCRLLGTPSMLRSVAAPVVFYCDEPIRSLYEPEAKARSNPATRGIYGPMHSAERWLDRNSLAGVNIVGTNSSYTATRIEETYGRAARLVPCGVDPLFIPRLEMSPTHVLSVGSLIPSKGHDLAIEALALSGMNWPMLVIAPWPNPPEQARLQRQAAANGIELDIRVAITDEELVDAYRHAFATLYLAQLEPFGLVSLEAQACGSPVIVADEGGLPETVHHGVTGWAVPREARSAAACLRLLGDTRTRGTMAQAGTDWGSGHTWRESALALGRLFQEAAS